MRPAIEEQLLAYQNQAMRTLGFAYRVLEDDAPVFEDGRIIRKDLVYLGIAAISDPVRDDVPQAVKDCMDAGIRIKIVTGDTPRHRTGNRAPDRSVDGGGHAGPSDDGCGV